MPGVDSECTTHYACECIEKKIYYLSAALVRYGKHLKSCLYGSYFFDINGKPKQYACTCGLREIIEDLEVK